MDQEHIMETENTQTDNTENTEPMDHISVPSTHQYSLVKGMVDSIVDPDSLFQMLRKTPKYMMMIVVISLITIALNAALMPKMLPTFKVVAKTQAMESARGDISPETLESYMIRGYYITVYGGFVMIVLMLLIKSLVIHFIFSFLLNTEKEFRHVFSVVVHSWTPMIILQIITTVNAFLADFSQIVTTKQMQAATTVPTGLDIFFDAAAMPAWLNVILADTSIFTIWVMGLICYGLSKVCNVKLIHSFLTIFVIWLMYLTLVAGGTYIGTMVQGA